MVPQVAPPPKWSAEYGLSRSLKAPRRAHADQLPQQQPKVAAGELNEQPLEHVGMSSKMDAPHPADLAHVREGTLRQFSPDPMAPHLDFDDEAEMCRLSVEVWPTATAVH